MGICFQKFFIFTKQDTGNRNLTVCVLLYLTIILKCYFVQQFNPFVYICLPDIALSIQILFSCFHQL